MGLDFMLVCDETRQKVSIGQGHHNGQGSPIMEVLYSGIPETMEALRRLLNETRGKPLRLVVSDYEESAPTWDYAEVWPLDMTFKVIPVLGTGRRRWDIVNGLGGRIDRFDGTERQANIEATRLQTLKRAGKPYLPR